jgi:hypothetical protein
MALREWPPLNISLLGDQVFQGLCFLKDGTATLGNSRPSRASCTAEVSRLHGRDPESAIVDRSRIESLIANVTMFDDRLSVNDGAEFLVRSVASGIRRASCSVRSHAQPRGMPP